MLLLDRRADPNVADLLGETPLFEAVANASLDIAAALLLRKADPMKQSPTGSSAFEQAEEGLMQTLLAVFQGEEYDDMAGNTLFDALGPQIQRGMSMHLRERQALHEMAAMRAMSAPAHGSIAEE
uniref:Uncharacterized protein n=1 Tax=Alexandrium catenella TaxID=2925 RepID=A0A7S1Q208_ALECA|mmetsp:Transcript_13345/g.36663  ORF Transcript_13345/g.36663 Transcript_13345/m.36663 type:complete len:125 (+) Transcript_13345:3-377(+)